MFKLVIEKKVEKFLSKLDFKVKQSLVNRISKLETKPYPKNKKHIIDSSSSALLCELSYDKWRIYYTIEEQYLIIEKVEYKGLVKILDGKSNHKSGNKNYPNQRKYLLILKNWFKKL